MQNESARGLARQLNKDYATKMHVARGLDLAATSKPLPVWSMVWTCPPGRQQPWTLLHHRVGATEVSEKNPHVRWLNQVKSSYFLG